MHSVFGFVDGKKSNKPTGATKYPYGTFNHEDLLNIGTSTHAQIEAHIINDINPHGTTLNQDSMGVNEMTDDGSGNIVINEHTFTNSSEIIGPVSDSNIVTLEPGILFDPDYNPFIRFYQSVVTATPTEHPWTVSHDVTFIFKKFNTLHSLEIVGYNVYPANPIDSKRLLFTNLVPAEMRTSLATGEIMTTLLFKDESISLDIFYDTSFFDISNGDMNLGPLSNSTNYGTTGDVGVISSIFYWIASA